MLRMMNQIGSKVTKFFGEPSIGVKGKSKRDTKNAKQIFFGNPFAEVLPFEAYDEDSKLFIGKNSLGFTIEANPLDGSDDSIEKEIASIFEEILDEEASIQCLLWADHRIDPFLQVWQKSRNGTTDVLKEMADKRADFFRQTSKFSPRIFRFILSYSIPSTDLNEKITANLVEKREKILKTLGSFTYTTCWNAKHFLEAVGGLVNFDSNLQVKKREWNCCETLSNQLTTGGLIECHKSGLEWKNEKDIAFKSFRVTDAPQHWSLGAMQLLIGDLYRDSYKINFPFYLHYGVHCPKQAKAENKFWKNSQLIEKQGSSHTLLRMIPQLETELKECHLVRKLVSQGARFVWAGLSAGIWAPKEQINQAEQSLKSLFRINQFSLTENSYLHLPQFLSCLPMTWAEYAHDLKNLNVLKTTLNTECSNFVPIQGEWTGTNKSMGMLLIGRRGQIINWNPFDNQSGNYNVVVVGRSGSGKSVFMQDLLLSGLGTGCKVYVIEVGRSFEKMCDSLNGQSIHFSKASSICLNPFSHISQQDEEDRDTSFSFLKSIIASMAEPIEGTTTHQNGLIEEAIRYAWNQKQTNASISDVAEWLATHRDSVAQTLSIMLTPYTKKGVHAKYFEGENNVNFINPMVLIELEELKEKKDLQAVVLQLFIMTITNQAFLGDRKTPFYICIDEAWDLLRAKQSGSFIETLARRLRKYNGSLVIGTQSVDDFFSTPGAQAAFENSDWMCLLSQNPSSIKRLAKSDKVEMSEHKQQMLESVATRQGEYSEVMITNANGHYSIARLILDPFSQLLYSTKAQEFAKIKDLQKTGMTISQAINHMLKDHDKK